MLPNKTSFRPEDNNNLTIDRTPSLLKIDSPSSNNSTMAHILIQQQKHRPSSTKKETLVPMGHNVDERLFFCEQDSADFLHFLQKFASEPQRPIYHSTSSQNLLDRNKINFPLSDSCLPSNDINKEEDTNCDNQTKTEDKINDLFNDILAPHTLDDMNEDTILNSASLLNAERHFRRRKRRTSLTRTSSSDNESEPEKNDSIEPNNSKPEDNSVDDLNENLERISLNENTDKKNESSNTQSTSSGRSRIRRLRLRSYKEPPSISQEPTSDAPVQFFVPNEIASFSPISTPPASPTSPIANPEISTSSRNTSTGALKRNGSMGTTKKIVRFADSVGRQLAQVQYIQSLTDDDSTDLSLLKNNLYIPKSLNIEHKPWSFDIELKSKQTPDIRVPKRFFCLYRQPNSEHPDIYLHEVWKSQIKLEYANMRIKSSLTGEQYLFGTVWVTNIGYNKNVVIQYTFNRWINKYEYEGKHCCHSNDFRNLDQFEFTIDVPHDVDRIDFVLRYRVNDHEHWDNNEGKNYTLETETAYTPQTTISLPHDCDFNEMRFY